MKYKITATCIIDVPDEYADEYKDKFEADNGEIAFDVLTESGEAGTNDFQINLEPV